MWMKMLTLWFAILSAALVQPTASSQPAPTSNYTSIEAIGEQPVQVGYYASANKNCTSAPLPTIRIVTPPKSGTFTVRRAKLKTSKVAGCPAIELNAEVAFYQARATSSGTDNVVYEVTSPNGQVAIYDVTITLKPATEQVKPPTPNSRI